MSIENPNVETKEDFNDDTENLVAEKTGPVDVEGIEASNNDVFKETNMPIRSAEEVKAEINAINQAISSSDFSNLENAPVLEREEWAEARVAELEDEILLAEGRAIEKAPQENLEEENTESVESLKSEVEQINTAVGSSDFSNLEDAPVLEREEWAEARVEAIEKRIRELESAGPEGEAAPESIEGRIEELTQQINELNRAIDARDYKGGVYGNDFAEMMETYNELAAERHELRKSLEVPQEESSAESVTEDGVLGEEAAAQARDAYEAAKRYEQGEGTNAWSWIKGKVSGLKQLSFWEMKNERETDLDTELIQKDVESQSKLIHQTENLDLDTAVEEAALLYQLSETLHGTNVTPESLQAISDILEREQKELNEQIIEAIVQRASQEVLKRAEQLHGKDISPDSEEMTQFETELREALVEKTKGEIYRTPQEQEDQLSLFRNIAEKLRPSFWRKNIYGGVERFLISIGLKFPEELEEEEDVTVDSSGPDVE